MGGQKKSWDGEGGAPSHYGKPWIYIYIYIRGIYVRWDTWDFRWDPRPYSCMRPETWNPWNLVGNRDLRLHIKLKIWDPWPCLWVRLQTQDIRKSKMKSRPALIKIYRVSQAFWPHESYSYKSFISLCKKVHHFTKDFYTTFQAIPDERKITCTRKRKGNIISLKVVIFIWLCMLHFMNRSVVLFCCMYICKIRKAVNDKNNSNNKLTSYMLVIKLVQ